MAHAFLKALRENFRRLCAAMHNDRAALLLVLLVAFAAAYYGSYYRHDLRFRDEGGTIALNAQRLLQGERPIVDVVLNYNVLWYYPITGLYQIFGVDFVLMRVWFFALSGLAAVLAFLAVTRAGRAPWIGFSVGLVCVLVPGMLFKNYIPLLVIANSYLLMLAALAPPGGRRSYAFVAGGGLLLGVTFLIRIDLGWFFSLLWIGLHGLRLFDRAVAWRQKLLAALLGVALTVIGVLLPHLPVLREAQHRGFAEPFTAHYFGFVRIVEREIRAHFGTPAVGTRGSGKAGPSVFWQRDTLRRSAWQDFLKAKDFEGRALIILTWLPPLTIGGLLGWTLIALARGWRSANSELYRRSLASLVLLGGSLTAFPQFFFFRPDSPHLSEFSPGYWVAVAGSILLLVGPRRPRLVVVLFTILAAHVTLYLARMLPDRWTGTIAARFGRAQPFMAENGVDVFVSRRDRRALLPLLQTIHKYSAPGEYVVAYPYHPTINVMANRPTYERNVYIDNATRPRRWDEEAIARFEKIRPAVIVLSDWEINGHEGSRFSRWAAPTKAWIETHYHPRGVFTTDVDAFEVFSRE